MVIWQRHKYIKFYIFPFFFVLILREFEKQQFSWSSWLLVLSPFHCSTYTYWPRVLLAQKLKQQTIWTTANIIIKTSVYNENMKRIAFYFVRLNIGFIHTNTLCCAYLMLNYYYMFRKPYGNNITTKININICAINSLDNFCVCM